MLIRSALASDVPAASEVLAHAFVDYPWTRWTVADDDHQRRLRDIQALYLEHVGLPHGTVTVAEVDGHLVGVAVWLDASTVPVEVWGRVLPQAESLAGDRAAAATDPDLALAAHRPTERHLALQTIGVAPSSQGHGIGRALLADGLTRLPTGLPVHLETSAASNVALYEELGFQVTSQATLPDGGPAVWFLRRKPTA